MRPWAAQGVLLRLLFFGGAWTREEGSLKEVSSIFSTNECLLYFREILSFYWMSYVNTIQIQKGEIKEIIVTNKKRWSWWRNVSENTRRAHGERALTGSTLAGEKQKRGARRLMRFLSPFFSSFLIFFIPLMPSSWPTLALLLLPHTSKAGRHSRNPHNRRRHGLAAVTPAAPGGERRFWKKEKRAHIFIFSLSLLPSFFLPSSWKILSLFHHPAKQDDIDVHKKHSGHHDVVSGSFARIDTFIVRKRLKRKAQQEISYVCEHKWASFSRSGSPFSLTRKIKKKVPFI